MRLNNPSPITEGYLDLQHGHHVKWYQYGNTDGMPVIYFHGGPGSGFSPAHAKWFDLNEVNLITFDQRGSGKSLPSGEMSFNTTNNILDDAERLRQMFGIENWNVAGRSWGATLALLYSENHPEYVRSITISSLFLARHKDNDWTFSGVRQFFPDSLDKLKEAVGAIQDGQEIVERSLAIFNGNDNDRKYDLALELGNYFSPMSEIFPSEVKRQDIDDASVNRLKIFLSYVQNGLFISENQICKNAGNLKNIPIMLLHGRLDFDCPVEQAFAFKESCPHANFAVIQSSHSINEEPLRSAYISSLKNNIR